MFTILLIFVQALVSITSGRIIFCYWGTWAYYRTGLGKFELSNIDPRLCTHIGYNFLRITEAGIIQSHDSRLDNDLKYIDNLVATKEVNRNLKVLISVGGWDDGSAKYSSMAADPVKRATFISSIVAFIKQHGCDGLDFHWKYPAQRGGEPADRDNYITLLKELKTAFKPDNYILAAGVVAAEWSASQSYNIKEMSQYVDLINVLTFDFHGPWDKVLGHNSALNGEGQHTVAAAINYWLSQGASASQLLLGISLYGHSYALPAGPMLARAFTNEAGFLVMGPPLHSGSLNLTDSLGTDIGAAALGPGSAGPYTNTAGSLGYNEICANLDGWTKEWDAEASVPYAYKGNQWISYDNVQSITAKVNFIKEKKLGGAVVWSLEADDFRGTCGNDKFPLLRVINDAFKYEVQMPPMPSSGKTIFCYWGTWSYHRPGLGQFRPANIDPQLCTHIGYAFFGITDDGTIKLVRSNVELELRIIRELVDLKHQNPQLKIIASVGGWREGSRKYSIMAADAEKRLAFINSSLAFLQQHGFDGLDLDWEYPTQKGGGPEDRENYVTLLQELKSAFHLYKYSLSAAVGPGQWTARQSYNIPSMAKHLDFINVMTYDFHSGSADVLGYKAPLHGNGTRTLSATIMYWLSQGAPASKILLGIPLSGLTFTLTNSSRTIVGSPVSGPGVAGSITHTPGHLSYNEICVMLKDDWTQEWDADAFVPYAHKGTQWMAYDNQQSITAKLDFVKEHDLGGVMMWSIEADDFHGSCGGRKYSLLRTIHTALSGHSNKEIKKVTTDGYQKCFAEVVLFCYRRCCKTGFYPIMNIKTSAY